MQTLSKEILLQALGTSIPEKESNCYEEDHKHVTKHLCTIRGKMRPLGWHVVLLPGEGYRLVPPKV